ncbi:ECF RNA polymerase sigma factor SigK [Bremerella volcania]|uniref:ECF RNA polymerase sigma factor SigK n=1 Tax=Bremerella volcania TaxID=2527984 RepID=A0A518CC66_9BACT|nr:sigma-70 family RNA polymerase sigma factor [Bremerella volcania]QDU76810.1 ECF RNA polymerase sigma factor SigK [Bremerella volcania]
MKESLLQRIAAGDSVAITACIDKYGGLVWSLARRLSPTTTDAEDAVQEIFVDIWRNAERFRAEVADEATFVAMLARRRLIDRLRKYRRELDSHPIDEQALQYPSPSQTPRAEIADEASRATACLERLRSDERNVLELSIYHGLPQTRISERTGMPLGTVKTHARRGLVKLRDCMRVKELRPRKGVEA